MAKKMRPGNAYGPKGSRPISSGHVEPDAHGNREQRRAWARLYGKDYVCSGDQNVAEEP